MIVHDAESGSWPLGTAQSFDVVAVIVAVPSVIVSISPVVSFTETIFGLEDVHFKLVYVGNLPSTSEVKSGLNIEV